jgi:DNA-binding NarL/FixJ family response regulator
MKPNTPISSFLLQRETLLLAGSLGLLLAILRWVEQQFLVVHPASDLYSLFLALVFLVAGVALALLVRKRLQPKVAAQPETPVTEARITDQWGDPEEVRKRLGLTRREMEVLQAMARGESNQEIADRLHVSLSTIKTHASGVLSKLGAERRTQAIELARKQGLDV